MNDYYVLSTGYALSNFIILFQLPMEKEMSTHSSTLAWRIPWTEEPGRLQSMGSESDTSERLYYDIVTQLMQSLLHKEAFPWNQCLT